MRSFAPWCLMLAVVACGEVHKPPGEGPDGSVPGDGPPQVACTTNAMCSGAQPTCDTVNMVCVACTPTDIGACGGTTPVCATDETCRACTAHSECSSGVCMPDGSCGNEADVAFVDAAASGSSACSKAQPCNTVALALATGKTLVKLKGTFDEPVALASRNTTFLAEPGATLKNTNGDGITLTGSTKLEVYDLTVTAKGTGIISRGGTTAAVFLSRVKLDHNGNGGVSMESGTLNVVGSTISTNTGAGGIGAYGVPTTITTSTFSNNSGGSGILAYGSSLSVSRCTFTNNINGGLENWPSGTFVIVNNVFFNNGSNSSGRGGVYIDTAQSATNRLEFNTIIQNRVASNSLVAAGIHCTAGTFTARNNVLLDNQLVTNKQFGGTCLHTYSNYTPGEVPAGTGNLAMAPQLANPATGDAHLLAASPLRGKADPAADLTGLAAVDFDGDSRAAPADIGADQFKP